MHYKVKYLFVLVSRCLQQLYVKELNQVAPTMLNMFVDVTTSCTGYIEAVTVFAQASGTVFIGLWEELSSSYILRQTFRVEVPSSGLHSRLSLPDGKIRVEPGQILGIHGLRGGSAVVKLAQTGLSNLATTGYTESQMSRSVNLELYSDGLPIGKEVPKSYQSYKRMPALTLHIVPEGKFNSFKTCPSKSYW